MIYVPELYYFNSPRFDYRKSVFSTARGVGKLSDFYKAELLTPVKGVAVSYIRQGALPKPALEKIAFVEGLIDWIFVNSLNGDVFNFFLDNKPIDESYAPAKFDHRGTLKNWVLNLNADEFKTLRENWEGDGFPEDLFYPKDNTIVVPIKTKGLKKIITGLLSETAHEEHYTPRQWEKLTTPET